MSDIEQDYEPDENDFRWMAEQSLDEARRTLGVNVRELRRARGWSQGEVIERLRGYEVHYAQTTMTKLENGQRPTPAEEVWALAQVFDVDYDRLLAPVPSSGRHDTAWALARARQRLRSLQRERPHLARRLAELDVSIMRAEADVRDLESRMATYQPRTGGTGDGTHHDAHDEER